MEEVEVSLDELPPDLNDYLTDLAGLIEELIARGTQAPFITLVEYSVLISDYDEVCISRAIDIREVRGCRFKVIAMAKPNVDFYLVIDESTYSKLVGEVVKEVPDSLIDEVGGSEVYSMLADVLDRLVGYLFALGVAMLGRAVKTLNPDVIMDYLVPIDYVRNKIIGALGEESIRVFVKL